MGKMEYLISPDCPFCRPGENMIVTKHGTVMAIKDRYPVTPGHLLIIPVRHTPDYFSMTTQERRDAGVLIDYLTGQIRNNDPTVEGFNIGVNCGEVAGQTIMHAHIHLIPRRQGDTPAPRGGVRGVIPGKMNY